MTTIADLDGVLVDEETGEVLEGLDLARERVQDYQMQERLADEQVKSWELRRGTLRQLLNSVLDTSYRSEHGHTIVVKAGQTTSAPAANLKTAVELELLTNDQAAQIALAAAKDLDHKEVTAQVEVMLTAEACAKALLVLINHNPRRGYAYTRAPLKPAPEQVTR